MQVIPACTNDMKHSQILHDYSVVYRHKIRTTAKNYGKTIVNVHSQSTINTTLLIFLKNLHKSKSNTGVHIYSNKNHSYNLRSAHISHCRVVRSQRYGLNSRQRLCLTSTEAYSLLRNLRASRSIDNAISAMCLLDIYCTVC